jgi:hypothetical protein
MQHQLTAQGLLINHLKLMQNSNIRERDRKMEVACLDKLRAYKFWECQLPVFCLGIVM